MRKRFIFVFGSNRAGIHGLGAARDAYRFHGAKQGVGIGITGNSYAIPTKDENLKTLPLETIRRSVEAFLQVAETHQDCIFYVTPIGCGLAGYTIEQIAPMFKNAPLNVLFNEEFSEFLSLLT